MHGMLHSEKYGALPTVTSIHLDPSVLHLTVQNQGWGNITVAQVQIAGELLSVPALEPGQSQVWEIPGSFDEGDLIPVTVEWKKRIHPDSNWGRVVFNAEVEDVSGRLYAKLPAKELAPSMGTLLPEPMDVFEPDSPAAMIVTDDENKGASLVLLPLLFVALAALVLRRR